ncbi:MAG: cytochrome b [Alphaproteobacteria bacterium]|nr:cytochrome b [Alphaproteobacteria bacterium]
MQTILKYTAPSRLLHWLMALLIAAMFTTVWVAEDAPEWLDHTLVNMHKSFGIVLLALIVIRIVARVASPRVEPIKASPAIQKGSHAVHGILYLLLIAMPLSGWAFVSAFGRKIDFFTLTELPAILDTNKELGKAIKEFHEIGANLVLVLVIAHVAAAAYHHFLLKDKLMDRMLP